MISAKKKQTNKAWDKDNMRYMTLALRDYEKDLVVDRARELGLPVNRYIRGLILDDIGRNAK